MNSLPIQDGLPIGVLAQRTGCNVPTIRYYEEIGLIPAPKRRPSGHRYYDAAAQELLSFIRRCRDFGFSIEQVRELVALSGSAQDCVASRDIAQAHLDLVRAKQAELRALERSLASLVKSCTDACAGGPAAECILLKDLGSADAGTLAKPGCCG